ncbi:hypothetical protein LOD99_11169 [Oopsacas minuta]|uniref:Basic leucine zipper domain-containing protein n=1 Tax=Oopsacas minuta TaxID=111878 RepID=A0AAV7K7M2_9METZ|nr:hypothetical protein LOD99_11169 [Oopsacas minuta]
MVMIASNNNNNIATMGIKELNRLIKDKRLTTDEARNVKQSRRLIKMCKYNKDQRQKKKSKEKRLEVLRDSLLLEYEALLQEVEFLRGQIIDLEFLALLDLYEENEAYYDA